MTANSNNPSSFSAEALDTRVADANRVLVGGQGRLADAVAAAALYRAAAEQGVGAAAERLAVLAAAGIGRPADWQESVDWLSQAAEMGHRPSQAQLCVLAGREAAVESVGGDWKSAVGEIDLRALLKAPPLRKVRECPAIALIDGLATPAMCRWLIARAQARVEPSLIGDARTGQSVRDPIRTGLGAGFGVATTDVVFVLTQKRLELASGLSVPQQEAPFVLSYEAGQEYKAHYDFFPPGDAFARVLQVMGQRVATCLTWLNDDYEGGETAFPKIGWKHRGKIGDAMLFLNVDGGTHAPDPMTLHAGLPVLRGRKWLLSQWIRDRAQAIV